MIHVVLVDDQHLIREGVRQLLELSDDIIVVGMAATGREALELVREEPPDVLLLDVRMPDGDGIWLLEQLVDLEIQTATILLTTFADDAALLRGLRAGAAGFLLKDVRHEDLLEAVRAVSRGETAVHPVTTHRILRGMDTGADREAAIPPIDALTRRETEVLRLMAGGFSNSEIAHALGLAEGTVKNHVSRILSKLSSRDRIQAVLRAIEFGLL